MRRSSCVFLGLTALFTTTLSFADEPTVEQRRRKPPLSEADETRFRALVKDAVRAADAGRLADAIKAYDAALELRADPLISGRLGLILAMFDTAPTYQVGAAANLYRAITEHAGSSRAERKIFFDAFDLVQTRICRADITTSDVNSFVQIDDRKTQKSDGAFWLFIEPGKHEFVGTLEGHDTVRKTVECPKGKKIEVFLNFPAGEAEVKTVERVRDRVVFVESPSPMSNADKVTEPEPRRKRRLNVNAGPAMVFGAAPSPAFGISLSTTYDLGSILVNAGTRGAYAVGPFANTSVDVFSFTGLAGPCKRWSWFNACAHASINVIKPTLGGAIASDAYTTAKTVPGFGLGISGRRAFSNGFTAYASGDATFLTERYAVHLSKANRTAVLWEGSPFLASLSLGVEFAP